VVFNHIHNRILEGITSDLTQEYLDMQTRRSLAEMQVRGIPSQSYIRAEQLGHSPVKDNSLALSMEWLRDYGIGCWYKALSIPANWFVMVW